MRYAVDPRQMTLFEPAAVMFSPMTIKYLSSDWPGVFRYQMLYLMPAEALGKHFDAKLGCPTKELYGMAGAIFLKEFFNLTIPQTVERYLTDAAWQYALNVNPMEASLSHATVERYLKLFAEDDLAGEVFHRVTSALIEALELDVSRQRLDSTHIFSDMATFGRSKLMGVTIKRFLVQLKRHHRDLYEALGKDFLARYAPSQATDAFRENFRVRGGGESVNSGLKRKTGMGRLRVRGSPRVRMAVFLRCAGWNLFRALATLKQRGIRDLAAVFAVCALIRTFVSRIMSLPAPFRRLDRRNIAHWTEASAIVAA